MQKYHSKYIEKDSETNSTYWYGGKNENNDRKCSKFSWNKIGNCKGNTEELQG